MIGLELEKEYLSGLIRNEIQDLPEQKKYEYIAELEMALIQHVMMIDKIGELVGGLNNKGIKVDNKVLYSRIVKIAAKDCVLNPFQ